MRGVWMIVWLTFSFFAAAQDPTTKKKDNPQVDSLAKQKISDIFSAVQHSDIG